MPSETKRKSSFITQAVILAGAGLLVRFLGFLYRVPLTNMIGNEGNSIYTVGYNIYNFFLIMSSAGLPAAISKIVSEKNAIGRPDEAHRVFKTAFRLSAVSGFACMLIILFGADAITTLLQSPYSKNALLTLAPTVFIVSLMAVFRGYFQGMGSTAPTAVSQVIEQVLNAVFSVVLAGSFMNLAMAQYANDDLMVRAAGAAGGTTGTGIGAAGGLIFIAAYYLVSRRSIKSHTATAGSSLEKQPARSIVREILRTALPIIAGTAVFSITNLIDMAMVKSRLSYSGIVSQQEIEFLYGQLSGKFVVLTTLPVSISSSIATAAIPAIAASYKIRDSRSVESKINTSLRMSMLISIPAAFGMGFLGDPIIRMLYPSSPDGGYLLYLGFAAIIFLALTQILTGMLQAIGRVGLPVRAALCGAAVKIALNYILVGNPNIRISGAVFGTIGCYIVTSVINWRALTRETGVKPDIKGILLKPGLASLGMGLSCFAVYQFLFMLIGSNTAATIAAIIVGVAVYLVLMCLIGGIREEDVRLLPFGAKLARKAGRFLK